jgi:glucose-1-phosphate thymidylyltransferase
VSVVGIIPAAGYATRLQPLSGSKEVVDVRGKPVMDHQVERMLAGGSTRLRVVTRSEKEDVIAHAAELGAEVVLARPETVSASFLAGMTGLEDDDVVLVDFPDTIWEPVDGFARLVAEVEEGCDAALGLFRIDASELPRSDVVVRDPTGRIERIDVKPAQPASDWIWGCAAARVSVWAGLGTSAWPGEYLDSLCREGRDVRGIELSETSIDVGTRATLERVRLSS